MRRLGAHPRPKPHDSRLTTAGPRITHVPRASTGIMISPVAAAAAAAAVPALLARRGCEAKAGQQQTHEQPVRHKESRRWERMTEGAVLLLFWLRCRCLMHSHTRCHPPSTCREWRERPVRPAFPSPHLLLSFPLMRASFVFVPYVKYASSRT